MQITLEDGQLSGYITRFGESDSDKGQLIDQFFSKGSLQNNHLTFATKAVHGVWYEFDGAIEIQPGKARHGRLSRSERHSETAHSRRQRRRQSSRAHGRVQVLPRRREPVVEVE